MSKPDPIIIGLTGPKGADKDTVADFLVEQHGYTKLAFADALREEICHAFNVPMQLLTQRETKEHPMSALALSRCLDSDFVNSIWWNHPPTDGVRTPRSPRQIMQWWGTEYRRAQRPNYWTFKLEDAIGNAYKSGQNRFVITDVRFADEADMLLGLGATLWQIQRPGHEPQPGEHSSESTGAQFAPHFVLTNNASITHLHSQAYAALKKQDQLRHFTSQLAELEGEALEPEAATSRETHFFLAGWNGAVLNVNASEHFQKVLASAPQCIALEATEDMLSTARSELEMLRKALGVSVEPHQSLFERVLEAAESKAAAPAVLPEPDAVTTEVMSLVNEVQKNRVCAEMSPSNKDHFNDLAIEASKAIEAKLRALLATGGRAQADARDAAFEAVRKKFCKLQRYSFFLDDKGNVRRVPQFTGNWVEFESVHTLFDPASVAAAIEVAKGVAA